MMPRTTIPLYLVTFNCARLPHSTTVLSAQILSGLPVSSSGSSSQPELIVLALEELAPLAASFLGGNHLTSYFTPFSTAVRLATRKAFDEDYALVTYRNTGLTGIMIFARHAKKVKFIEYGEVGTGIWEMGNKGGVGVRLGYEGSEGVVKMNFVAMHLAAHEWNVEGRNKDWESIVRGLVFEPSSDEPSTEIGIYHPTSHLFVMGDLNYRTSNVRPHALEYLIYPKPTDSPSSNTHYLNLFAQDQLNAQLKQGNTLHGLVEEEVTFPPTYKFRLCREGVKEDREERWDWSTRRWPSWTDRILYLPLPPIAEGEERKEEILAHNYTSIPRIFSSDHRPVVLHLSIPAKPLLPPPSSPSKAGVTDPRVNPPFPISKDWKSKRLSARRKEIIVGVLAWLVTTWTGLGAIMAFILGGIGGWWVLRAFPMEGYKI